MIKGVILAGGMGSRLFPLTKVTNKHLLPVYNKPMIYYPIETLVRAGIRDIMIVTGGNSAGDFLKLLGNGKDFGLKHISYAYQEGEGGIAAALSLTEHFVDGEKMAVVLGDNILEQDISPFMRAFERQKEGARLLLKEVPDPERFGVAALKGKKISGIIEKPKKPVSHYAVVGVYMYDANVFNIIRPLKPSGRGELEITDVNNAYLKRGTLEFDIIDGYWTDAGTFDSLYRAGRLVYENAGKRPANSKSAKSAKVKPAVTDDDL